MRMSVSSPASTPAINDARKTMINPVLKKFECQNLWLKGSMILNLLAAGELCTVLRLVGRNYKKAYRIARQALGKKKSGESVLNWQKRGNYCGFPHHPAVPFKPSLAEEKANPRRPSRRGFRKICQTYPPRFNYFPRTFKLIRITPLRLVPAYRIEFFASISNRVIQ